MTAPITLRQQVGLQATYQAEAMLRTLLHAVHHYDFDELPHLLQAMLPRVLELNGVSMTALDSADSDSVASMIDRLHGGHSKLVEAAQRTAP